MQVQGSDGVFLKHIVVRIATGHDASAQAWDARLTENDLGQVTLFPGNVLVSNQQHGGQRNTGLEGCTLYFNDTEPNPRYKARSIFYPPLAGSVEGHLKDPLNDPSAGIAPIVILDLAGGGPPPVGPITGNGTCAEWKSAVFAIFVRHGFTTVGPDNEGQGMNQAPNLRATEPEIKALHPSAYVRWQFETVGNPRELKPRLFLPHDGADPYARWADIGDWDGPLKWEHCK